MLLSFIKNKYLLLTVYVVICSIYNFSFAQDTTKNSRPAAAITTEPPLTLQRDLIDYAYMILHKNPALRVDSTGNKTEKLHFSGAPSIEYSLTTALAVTFYGNIAFFINEDGQTNISSVLLGIGYTQKGQFFVPLQSSVWTKGNKYNLLGDWRYDRFPQDTYGFGNHTTLADGYTVTYDRVRFYEFALKNVAENFYIGPGIQFDHHWNIREEPDASTRLPTDFEKYGFSNTSTSSGISLDLLYDTRKNSINPQGGGFYSNVVFRQNTTLLGSNTSWNSLLIDVRKYIQLPHNNILAFWSYNNFTLSGNPPYLDLPGTATDTYSNTGRGYVQGRFIGKKMMDLEAELRYGITRNGLLGGVVFANAESLSELGSNRFEAVSPAVGAGLRIKFNKFSKTNICLDYGIGAKGSHGIFANLGEVF